jgi:hypothetical protein
MRRPFARGGKVRASAIGDSTGRPSGTPRCSERRRESLHEQLAIDRRRHAVKEHVIDLLRRIQRIAEPHIAGVPFGCSQGRRGNGFTRTRSWCGAGPKVEREVEGRTDPAAAANAPDGRRRRLPSLAHRVPQSHVALASDTPFAHLPSCHVSAGVGGPCPSRLGPGRSRLRASSVRSRWIRRRPASA